MSIKPEKEIDCTIHGKVQNVRFREFAKNRADELGLCGFVRNSKEGYVEVLAQGAEESLRKYVELLKKGPVFATVESADVEWHDMLSDTFTEFTIEE